MLKSIHKSKIYACTSKKYISKFLSDNSKELFVKTKEIRNPDHHFLGKKKVFYESKKTGIRYEYKPSDFSLQKYREFTDASIKHKKILRRLNYYLSQIPTPKYLFSKKESDYKKNAIHHIGNTKFILLDISGFFPHCSFTYVKSFFLKETGLNMKRVIKDEEGKIIREETDVADSLARLVTVPLSVKKANERYVPQGFPTSTLISFFSYKEMFDEIYKIALENNLKFSTYVDDLTFSYIDNDVNPKKIIDNVKIILEKYGHKLSEKKIKVIDIEKVIGVNKEIILPQITGLIIRRYKVRASKDMHNKMNRLFNQLNSFGNPTNAKSYLKKWQYFVSLVGIYNTIKFIEPKATEKRRIKIKRIINNNRKHFLFHISIKRIKQLKKEQQIYDAYRSGTLEKFVKKHRKVLIDYRENQ